MTETTVTQDVTLDCVDLSGNVRQLENLVERAVTLADASGIISPDLLASQIDMFEGNGAQPAVSPGNDQSLKDIVEQMEAFYIREAMESHSGNITKVAQQLGLSRLGLHKKLQRYQIDSTIYKQSKQ